MLRGLLNSGRLTHVLKVKNEIKCFAELGLYRDFNIVVFILIRHWWALFTNNPKEPVPIDLYNTVQGSSLLLSICFRCGAKTRGLKGFFVTAFWKREKN